MSLLDTITRDALDPALELLPVQMDSPEVRVLLLATGLQESKLIHRRQLVGNPPRPVGPAKGLLQFERGGGCKGVVEHPASRYWMAKVCEVRAIRFTATALWNAVETDDVLAMAAGRLLYFTEPRRLPALDDAHGAWLYYLRTWRPGAYTRGDAKTRAELRAKWARYYQQALDFVAAEVLV